MIGPIDPRPVGAGRPAPTPLDRGQLDSALAVIRSEMAASRLRLGPAIEDRAKALAERAPADLSAAGRRALARAVIADEQRRDREAQVAEKGRRPALVLSGRLSFGGPRRPALPDSVVRAMLERNAARVRQREDSLRLASDSVRIRRELARRDSTRRDSTRRDSLARGAQPDAG
ncbi:MAG: hypothetical protein ACXWZS_18770 [Gemmatirosa sp.]